MYFTFKVLSKIISDEPSFVKPINGQIHPMDNWNAKPINGHTDDYWNYWIKIWATYFQGSTQTQIFNFLNFRHHQLRRWSHDPAPLGTEVGLSEIRQEAQKHIV